MTKATQVSAEFGTFSIPPIFKGGVCVYCKAQVPDYHGFRISPGTKVFCNFKHYLKNRRSKND